MSEDINARMHRMDQAKLREPVRPYSNKLAETLKESAIIAKAKADERAAIVDYIRKYGVLADCGAQAFCDRLADAIQSGAHHKQEGE